MDDNLDEIVQSWKDALSLRQESNPGAGDGFRSVQLGAIYAIKAHLISKPEEKGIVVMPTGTGKTDVMISTMVGEQFKNILVLVPSIMLREQTANSFEKLGILKKCHLIKNDTKGPLVQELKKWPENPKEFFSQSNVIVVLPNTLIKHIKELESLCKDYDAVFVDEAHHVPASTWQEVVNMIGIKKCIMFTATPFRNDGKLIPGTIIYDFTLGKALRAGYFTEIDFLPVEQYDKDKEHFDIAKKALTVLRKDLDEGFNHKLLVRADTIEHAEKLYDTIYNSQENADLYPVLITSQKKYIKPKNAMELYKSGQSRIVVGVDMFKEGIDDAQFKIGALHNTFKSLPVTLQFIGRLTRVRKGTKEHAKFVANIADDGFIPELQALYSEDAEWSYLLPVLSDYAISKRVSFQKLVDEFNMADETEKFELEYILARFNPKFSMKVYQLEKKAMINDSVFTGTDEYTYYCNKEKTLLLVINVSRTGVDWLPKSDCRNVSWNYSLLLIDNDNHLCYCNCAMHGVNENAFVRKYVSCEATNLPAEHYFRVFGNLSQCLMKNVGLRKTPIHRITYQSFMGDAVQAALSLLQTHDTSKIMLFGIGYSGKGKETIGASANGRIWSFSTGRLDAFRNWALINGKKLVDETISTDKIIHGVIIPKLISSIPSESLLYVRYGDLTESEKCDTDILMFIEGQSFSVWDTSLFVIDQSKNEIHFKLQLAENGYEFVYHLEDKKYFFSQVKREHLLYVREKSTDNLVLLEKYFSFDPPAFTFADRSWIAGNQQYKPKEDYSVSAPYDDSFADAWLWDDCNIRQEACFKKNSTGQYELDKESIQYKVIKNISDDFDVVYVDDGAGESADIVAIGKANEKVNIHFYHCKYSKENKPGARKGDLYEVCGQAICSWRWQNNPVRLCDQLIRRSSKHPDRFMKGNVLDFRRIKQMVTRYESVFCIHIVQPGISKKELSPEITNLLSNVRSELMDYASIESELICSE